MDVFGVDVSCGGGSDVFSDVVGVGEGNFNCYNFENWIGELEIWNCWWEKRRDFMLVKVWWGGRGERNLEIFRGMGKKKVVSRERVIKLGLNGWDL